MRILIAEDDAALAGFVRQGLQGEHYSVEIAEDGEQARTMGSEVDYDLVILDLNLPRLDGVSVLRHLRLKRPSMPVLVLTLRSKVEDRVQCLDIGGGRLSGQALFLQRAFGAHTGVVAPLPFAFGVGAGGG